MMNCVDERNSRSWIVVVFLSLVIKRWNSVGTVLEQTRTAD